MKEYRDKLTVREKEVLLGICEGKCNKKIAKDLHITLNTVKKHVYNVYRKTGVKNRFQATLWSVKHI